MSLLLGQHTGGWTDTVPTPHTTTMPTGPSYTGVTVPPPDEYLILQMMGLSVADILQLKSLYDMLGGTYPVNVSNLYERIKNEQGK